MTSTLSNATGRTDRADEALVDSAPPQVAPPQPVPPQPVPPQHGPSDLVPPAPVFRGVSPTAAMTAEFRIPSSWRLPRSPGAVSDPVTGRPSYAPVPLPPTKVEKYLYLERALRPMMLASLVSFGCLLASQVLFIRSQPFLWVLAPFTALTVVYYLVALSVNAFTRGFDARAHQRIVREWCPEEYPSVDVFLPVCGEPTEVLRNTWEHVRRMAQHYPGQVTSTCWTTRRPRRCGGWRCLRVRVPAPPEPGLVQEGRQHAVCVTSARTGDYILVLDADFAPRHDLLDEMLPYFDDRARRRASSSRRSSSGCTPGRAGWSAAPARCRSCSTGRCRCPGSTTTRRSASAAARSTGGRRWTTIGGSTLIEHSEDVHTGFDLGGAAGACVTCRSCWPPGSARPTWTRSSPSSTVVRRLDEPARVDEVLETRLRLRPGCATSPASATTCTPALFTFVAPLVPIVMLTCVRRTGRRPPTTC